jgi:hypothetical protein
MEQLRKTTDNSWDCKLRGGYSRRDGRVHTEEGQIKERRQLFTKFSTVRVVVRSCKWYEETRNAYRILVWVISRKAAI